MSTPTPHRALARRFAVAAALLALTGCGEVVLVDPTVTFSSTTQEGVVGEFGLTLGVYREQLFRPLADGDEVEVVYGFQGGTWMMPALRCTGVTETVTLSARLTLDDGELLGVVPPYDIRLDRTPDGPLDANAIPIPVEREDPAEPLEDIFGREAELVLELSDRRGSSGTLTIRLTLVEG